MKIRRANESDLPQLIAISEASGAATHWTQPQWLDIFKTRSPMRIAWIAEEEIEVHGIGFLIAQQGGPEWELENIAVLPGFRRQGVGRGLMSALLTQARALLAERILLEVRESNLSAIHLYNVSGFELLARRRDYYRKPEEDALIMVQVF